MNLGNYTTIDCPEGDYTKAEEFLIAEFDKIGGTVRVIQNPHDFGEYPSFEIDYPEAFEDLEFLDEDDEDLTEEENLLFTKREVWHEVANEIQAKFNSLFFN